jgi:amino acid adenylation domain-containing protein
VKLSDFSTTDELRDRETAALVQRVNRTETPYPRDGTVPRIFADRVAATPEAVALVQGDLRLTYRELDRRSNRLAHFLADRGLEPESLVAIQLDRSPAMIVAMLGAMKAGGAYLPISPDLPAERLAHILRDSRTPVLIVDHDRLSQGRDLEAACSDLRTVMPVDASGALAAYVDGPALDRSRPGNLAYVIYTSGTTGVPKGVMVEHRAILRLVLNTNYIRLDASDRILQTGAPSFDASTFEIWGALLNGGRLCLPHQETLLSARGLARLVKQHGITTMWLTAGLFNALVSEDAAIFDGVKTVLCGGEKLSPHHVNRVRRAHPGLVLINGYGPTENTTFTTTFEIREEFATDIPIGRPIANTTVQILNERLEPVPIGVPGELHAGGDGLARGYLNDPELTAAKFIADPSAAGQRLYRTGDLACWRPDGTIDYLGRLDDQVKIRGYRIEPGEIEAPLLQHGQLKEAVVVARTDQDGDRYLAADYTASGPVQGGDLRRHLARTLPEYMIPAVFVQLDELPLNGNGKVDRTALPEPVRSRRADDRERSRLPSETEAGLITIWKEALCRQDVGIDDNFFDLGGHSLRAVKLMFLIREKFDVLLPFTVIFEAPTVGALACRILDAVRFGHDGIDQPMVALNADRGGPPVFAFPPGSADALGYGELAKRLEPHRLFAFNFIEADTRIADYADLIMKVRPEGPYVLFGYSGGGNLAFRTAAELERRGNRVSDVIMLDSSRFLAAFQFPAEEARRLAAEFAGAEGVQAYLRSPVLKDKLIRMIERYYETLSIAPDEAIIDANIHVVTSDGSDDEYREDGRLICSKSAWASATRGTFKTYRGSGDHGHMLHRPHLEFNAALLSGILAPHPAAQSL